MTDTPRRDPEYFTLQEAADLVRLSPETIRRQASLGLFPELLHVSARRWIVPSAAVREFLSGTWVHVADATARLQAVKGAVLRPARRVRARAGAAPRPQQRRLADG